MPAARAGHGTGGAAQVLQQNVSGAVASQSRTPPVLQERLLFVDVATVGGEELANEPCRLRQQRT